jgi:hypothetical protein
VLLKDSGIALIGSRLDFRSEGRDGESVGRIHGAAKEETLAVMQGDDDRGRIPVVSRSKMVREDSEELLLVFDLSVFWLG